MNAEPQRTCRSSSRSPYYEYARGIYLDRQYRVCQRERPGDIPPREAQEAPQGSRLPSMPTNRRNHPIAPTTQHRIVWPRPPCFRVPLRTATNHPAVDSCTASRRFSLLASSSSTRPVERPAARCWSTTVPTAACAYSAGLSTPEASSQGQSPRSCPMRHPGRAAIPCYTTVDVSGTRARPLAHHPSRSTPRCCRALQDGMRPKPGAAC